MDRNLIKSEERKILQDIVTTEIKKENFVREIMGGLGDEILSEPNKIHQIQKKLTFWGRLKKLF